LVPAHAPGEARNRRKLRKAEPAPVSLAGSDPAKLQPDKFPLPPIPPPAPGVHWRKFHTGVSLMTQPIPPGFHTLTPHLVIRDAARAIEFYKKAFGAEVMGIMPTPDGKIMHAAIKIGDSIIMLNDEFPEMGSRSPQSTGGTSVTLHLYV